jgi:hypothetical protein
VHRLRSAVCLLSIAAIVLVSADGRSVNAGNGGGNNGNEQGDDATLNTSGASSVTYYDHNGGLHATTKIPGGSVMKRGGGGDRCEFVANVAGVTYDKTPYNPGDTVHSTRWVFSEEVAIPSGEAPGPGAIVIDTTGPLPRRLVGIACDTNHYLGTTWVEMNDPFWNPRPTAQQLRNDIQLVAPTVYTNPVVDRWGGLITRYPAWLAIHPAAWQTQQTPAATYRGWTMHLYTTPATLEFLVNFTPDPDKPSPKFAGTVACITDADTPVADGEALPAMPALPEQTTPGVNGPCMWTPPGPGTVTIQARIRYDVTLWVNGYQEPQPTYTYTGPVTAFDTGELTAVNTND